MKAALKNSPALNDYCVNFGQQALQDEMERILGDFDENLEYYPITWGVLDGESLFFMGVFWENEQRKALGLSPVSLTETIFRKMGLSVEIPVFEVLESSSALINYERQQFVIDAYFGALTSPRNQVKRLNLVSSDTKKKAG